MIYQELWMAFCRKVLQWVHIVVDIDTLGNGHGLHLLLDGGLVLGDVADDVFVLGACGSC